MVYLISYDLYEKSEESYEKLINAISSYPIHCKVLKSQWLVSSSQSIDYIYDTLTHFF
jgi:hypothetical protein